MNTFWIVCFSIATVVGVIMIMIDIYDLRTKGHTRGGLCFSIPTLVVSLIGLLMWWLI